MGSIFWAFRTLKLPRNREMSAPSFHFFHPRIFPANFGTLLRLRYAAPRSLGRRLRSRTFAMETLRTKCFYAPPYMPFVIRRSHLRDIPAGILGTSCPMDRWNNSIDVRYRAVAFDVVIRSHRIQTQTTGEEHRSGVRASENSSMRPFEAWRCSPEL